MKELEKRFRYDVMPFVRTYRSSISILTTKIEERFKSESEILFGPGKESFEISKSSIFAKRCPSGVLLSPN